MFTESRKHARYFDPDIPYHIIFRIFQGRFLLVPDKRLNSIIAGVIGRAQSLDEFSEVTLAAASFMCNHAHLLAQGPPDQLVGFIAYIQREISRRWGREINWPSSMWESYIATALPTVESHQECFKYILSQGVKEGLVERPEQWPGFHAAKYLTKISPCAGEWLDGTRYGKANYKYKKRVENKGSKKGLKRPKKRDYTRSYNITFTRLACWAHLEENEYNALINDILNTITEEGRIGRNGRKPLGAKKVMAMSRRRRNALPPLPWFEERKKMIFWANPQAPETKAYVRAYWWHQICFRIAAGQLKNGVLDVVFPRGCFRPGLFVGYEA